MFAYAKKKNHRRHQPSNNRPRLLAASPGGFGSSPRPKIGYTNGSDFDSDCDTSSDESEFKLDGKKKLVPTNTNRFKKSKSTMANTTFESSTEATSGDDSSAFSSDDDDSYSSTDRTEK